MPRGDGRARRTRVKWDAPARARLLACEDDDALRGEFPGHSLAGLKRRRREARVDPTPVDRAAIVSKIEKLLADSNIDIDDVERLEKFTHKQWQGMTKDADGNPVVTSLEGSSIVLKPKAPIGPEWPVVQPAAPVKLPAPRPRAHSTSKWKTCVILPDQQIGYRRNIDDLGTLDPFHDEAAMALAIEAIRLVKPTKIINLGDTLDLAEIGRWVKEPGFQRTTQPALDRAHLHLAEQRYAAPDAEIEYVEGNHENRLPRWIMENAGWSFGLRRANLPESWPILSVPELLRLDELGVTYVPGYPAGITWINERLACIHGSKVRSSGSTAAAVIDDEKVSVIFGHVHRRERQDKTRRTRYGPRTALAISPGCLCRIDGAVPSTKGAIDPRGNVVPTAENWQQGFAVVTYQDGEGSFDVEQVSIHDGTAIFRGQPL